MKMIALSLSTALLLVLAGGGCASPEEYDAEPDRTINEEAVGAADVADAVGVAPPGPAPAPNPPGAVDRTDVLNLRKLAGVPEPVRNAFQRSYPNAGITSIDVLDAATGLTLYEINFMIAGQPYDVIYRPDGTPIQRNPLEPDVP